MGFPCLSIWGYIEELQVKNVVNRKTQTWFMLIRHGESKLKSSWQLGDACLFFHFSQELAVAWNVLAILLHNGSLTLCCNLTPRARRINSIREILF